MIPPTSPSPTPPWEVDAAVRSGDHVAWLSDVLRVIALEAIRHGPAGLYDVHEGDTGQRRDQRTGRRRNAGRGGTPDGRVDPCRGSWRDRVRPVADDERQRAELGYD